MSYYSRVIYANGGAGTYAVPFPYVNQTDVIVLDNGNPYAGAVTWPTPTTISLSPDIISGHTVEIRRVTSKTTPRATFGAGAIRSDDLNANEVQNLYLFQELSDLIGTTAPAGGGGGGGGGTLPGKLLPSIKDDYGAKCDATTNDLAAWNAAVADINAGLIPGVTVPGMSLVHGSINQITKSCSIVGAGMAVAGICHDVGSGDVTLMSISVVNAKQRVSIKDLSFMTKQANLGQALYISTSYGAVAMDNVDVIGYFSANLSFNRGIELVGVANGNFVNVNFHGYDDGVSPYPNNYLQANWAWNIYSEPTKAAFNTRWTNCDVIRCVTAWKGSGDLQGLTWVTCNPVFVGETWNLHPNIGVNDPYFAWYNCQCEYFNTGITLDNAAWVELDGCQFYADSNLPTTRIAFNCSNTVGVQVRDCLLSASAPTAGTDSGFIFTNCQNVTTHHNRLQGFSGTGIQWTGTSQYCSSYDDMIRDPTAGATPYKNDSSNALLNKRRRMELVGVSTSQGQQVTTNENATVGTVTTAANVPYNQIPFAVEPGDQLRVSLNVYCQYNGSETQIQATLREVTHLNGTTNPFQVFVEATQSQKNWQRTEHLTSAKFDAYFLDNITLDSIAHAPDALLSLELRCNLTTAIFQRANMKVERL